MLAPAKEPEKTMLHDHKPAAPVFSPEAGIALGPILFILAILGIIGLVLSAGGGGFTTAGVTDRIVADVSTQANLIRSKINECNMMYGSNSNYDGYPSSGGVSIAVSTIACSGDPSSPVNLQNLWSGNRTANLPPPTAGFGNWNYINTNTTGLGGSATGGRCIWIKPNSGNGAIAAGLSKAATKFTNTTANDGAAEVNYNPASTGLRFVVWISAPPTAGAETNDCNSNM